MPSPCPHCSEPIEKLSGFLSEDDHKARLKAKDGENAELRRGLSEAQTQVAGIADLRAERDALVTSAKKSERMGLLRGKVPDDQLETDVQSFELLHASAISGVEAPAEFADFAAWGATEHPLLKGFFVAPAVAPVVGKPALPLPNPRVDVPAPLPGGKPTVEQVQARFSSKEYLAMPIAERRAEAERLRALTR